MRTPRRLAPLLAAAALTLLAGAAPAQAQAQAQAQAPDRATARGAGSLATGLPAGVVVDPTAPALPADLTAAAWLVADLDTGQVLAARDAHAQHAPASTLKVLTALALLPEVPPETVVVPEQADIDVEGSKVGLVRGTSYRAEQLYAALLMASGNDTANVLGTAAGGHAAAARTMNATAVRLGALDTRAVNQHGLDAEGQLSSAHDLAVIARAALAEPDIARWVTTRRATLPGRPGEPAFEIYNHNKLLGSYDGALGVKNGYTSRARASFIGAAERDGRRLVVALMRAEPRVWAEAGQLLDWGFAATAAGAAPVGELRAPAPQPEPPLLEAAAEQVAGGVSDLAPVAGRQLAGALLVGAAVFAVRPPRRRRL